MYMHSKQLHSCSDMHAQIKNLSMIPCHYERKGEFYKTSLIILVGGLSTELPEVENFLIIVFLVFLSSFPFLFYFIWFMKTFPRVFAVPL